MTTLIAVLLFVVCICLVPLAIVVGGLLVRVATLEKKVKDHEQL